jgi:hypothetical protein
MRQPVKSADRLAEKNPQLANFFLKATGTQRRTSNLFDVLDRLFQSADMLLHIAFGLVFETLDLLLLVADQFAGFFLNFPGEVFGRALDLIFVHFEFHVGK